MRSGTAQTRTRARNTRIATIIAAIITITDIIPNATAEAANKKGAAIGSKSHQGDKGVPMIIANKIEKKAAIIAHHPSFRPVCLFIRSLYHSWYN